MGGNFYTKMIYRCSDKLIDGKVNLKKMLYILMTIYLIASSAYQRGTGFDAFLIRCVFVILLACTICVYPRLKITKMLKWLMTFWGLYFASALWASNVSDTFNYLNTAIQIIVIAVIIPTIINDSNDIEKILKALLFSFNYAAVLVLLRANFNFSSFELRLGNEIGLHPNLLGLRMAIGAILSYYFFKTEKKTKSKITSIISFLLMIIVLFLSGSRKSLVLCVVGILLYEIFQTKGVAVFYKVGIALVIGVIIINLLLTNEMLYYLIGRRIENVLLIYTGQIDSNVSDMSMNERSYYISEAINLFFKYPILGYGGNNFMSYMREIGYWHVAYSHNNFFELLSTLGIVGFSVYYYFWGYILLKLMVQITGEKEKNLRESSKKRSRKILFLIILVLLIILDYWNVSYINEINFIIMNIAWIDIIKAKNEIKDNDNEK